MHKRRWFQFSLRSLLLGVALFAILLSALLFLVPRLQWRLGGESQAFGNVRCVPTESMPVAETSRSLLRCRFGAIEFVLPPALAEGIQATEHVEDHVMLRNGARTVLVFFPERTDGLKNFLKERTASCSELQELTVPELRLAAYRASWEDFRWTMSGDEFQRHRCLVRLAYLTCLSSIEKVETFSCGDIEGLLGLSNEMASLEWYTRDGLVWGRMNFVDETGSGDFSWVRPVCRSVTFSAERFSDQTRKGEPSTSFRILEDE